MKKLNWGMLGTGWIAHEMGEALKRVNGEIYACCATSMESAEKYAEEFDVKNAYGSADEMFDDENIDIVYIATPHNSHYEFLMKALQSGKHVFCEKAITVNDTQLEEAVKLAKKKNLVIRGVQLRKHSKAREKRYSFGYAVSFIFACYQILWTFPKSRYLCSRYLPLVCG